MHAPTYVRKCGVAAGEGRRIIKEEKKEIKSRGKVKRDVSRGMEKRAIVSRNKNGKEMVSERKGEKYVNVLKVRRK